MLRITNRILAIGILTCLPFVLPAQESSQQETSQQETSQPDAVVKPTTADTATETPSVPASQQVYKSVGKDGKVIFTDAPQANQPADLIDVKPTNTVSIAPRSEGDGAQAKEPGPVKYKSLVITSPSNDAFFGQETESVGLSALLEPGLQEGHTAQLYYDGNPVGGNDLTYTVSNPERGTHTVEAKVFSKKKKILIASDKIQFHVRKISKLNKPPQINNGNNSNNSNASPTPVAGFSSVGGVKTGSAVGTGNAAGAGSAAAAGSASGAAAPRTR